MPSIVELFGFEAKDMGEAAIASRRNHLCPYVVGPCTKTFNDNTVSGVCSLLKKTGEVVPVCPKRLYAHDHMPLRDIAARCFTGDLPLVPASRYRKPDFPNGAVIGFGKGWGGELRLPGRGEGRGAYFVDWILVKVNADGELEEFVPVEVQTIDTTGSYKPQQIALMTGVGDGKCVTGFNWENVNKRILPQLIYKGHVLGREELCHKGLFFVCPEIVFDNMIQRLGGSAKLAAYPPRPGAITFMPYVVDRIAPGLGAQRSVLLVNSKVFTTTIEQIQLAFSSAQNLPEAGVYEQAIREALSAL